MSLVTEPSRSPRDLLSEWHDSRRAGGNDFALCSALPRCPLLELIRVTKTSRSKCEEQPMVCYTCTARPDECMKHGTEDYLRTSKLPGTPSDFHRIRLQSPLQLALHQSRGGPWLPCSRPSASERHLWAYLLLYPPCHHVSILISLNTRGHSFLIWQWKLLLMRCFETAGSVSACQTLSAT